MENVVESILKQLAASPLSRNEKVSEVCLKVGALDIHSEESFRQAFDIIVKGDGRTMPEHFDPDVLAAFLSQEDFCVESLVIRYYALMRFQCLSLAYYSRLFLYQF